MKYWVQQRIYWKFIWIAPLFPHQHVFIFKKIIGSNECRLHSNIYLCHKCSKRLERVSFKSAKYQNTFEWMTFDAIPQNVLIKFVRNTPTLKWFRSDLTHHENIAMLRSEQDQQEEFSKIPFVQWIETRENYTHPHTHNDIISLWGERRPADQTNNDTYK